ncbi:MAG: alpha/beta hydrolase [Chitinivibrionales bacterium]|nr:alpha/beta hydrolase [Chitinivibrionales bacterium]
MPRMNLFKGCKEVVVLIHGLGSSTAEWFEADGYTKGGNFVKKIEERKLSYIAYNLYGHGSFEAEESDFNPENIPDEIWPKFITRSVDLIAEGLKGNRLETKNIAIVTYSGGAGVATQLLKKYPSLPVSRLVFCSPGLQREYNDEYSLHNNLDCFSKRSLLLLGGKNDEEESIEDLRWFFGQLTGEKKKLVEYDAGHSLPVEWTQDAMDWISIVAP